MLFWTAVTAGAAAVVLVARWLMRRVDALGRPVAFPAWSVGLLALLCVAAAVPVARTAHLEDRLSQVASRLVGRPVTVDCQSRGQELVDVGAELGWVAYDDQGRPEPRTLIKRGPCAALAAYLRSDKHHPDQDQVVAVHVLTHEARHMAGQTVESEAECAAVQRDALTARLLGAEPADAAALARAYWHGVYPRMPDAYRTAECAAGARLDERLPDAPWLGG